MTAEDAATIIRVRTGARLTRYAIGDRDATGGAWLLESERLDAPEIYTDAGLIDFATSLERILG